MADTIYIGDLVEITANNSGTLPNRLMSEFYRHTTVCPAIFVLNGVTPASADEALDAVVASMPLSVAGVRYFRFEDEGAYAGFLPYAQRIWAATKQFRSRLLALGTPLERILALPWTLSVSDTGPNPFEVAASLRRLSDLPLCKTDADLATSLQGTV